MGESISKASQLLVLIPCTTPVPLINDQSLPSACRHGCPGFDFPHLGMARNKRVSFGTCPCESETPPQRVSHRQRPFACPNRSRGYFGGGFRAVSPEKALGRKEKGDISF